MPQVDQIRKHQDHLLHEIRNALEHLIGGDASSPIEGQRWYNSVTQRWRFRVNGSTKSVAWTDEIGAPSGAAGGDLTGTYPNPTVDVAKITLAKQANLAANSIIGNNTGSAAVPLALTVAQVKTLLAIASTDVSGLGSLALLSAIGSAQITDGSVANADLANMANATLKGRNTAGTGVPEDVTMAQLKTLLALVAANISDFDTQVRLSRLDQMAAPTADVSLASHRFTNSLDPVSAQDLVTKAYADGLKAGLLTKQPARLATAAALPAHTRSGNVLTASGNGALSVDSVAVANGDRVLVKDEGATHLEHAWYDVTDLGSAGTPWVLTRSDDADSGAELKAGAASWIVAGTVNAGTRWVLSTPATGTPTLNTTALGFTLDFAAVAATAGSGLVDEGAAIGAAAGYGVSVAADSIGVDKTKVPTFYTALIGGAGPATSYTVAAAGWVANANLIIQIIEVATGYDVTDGLTVARASNGDFTVDFDVSSVAGTAYRYVLCALPA